MRIEFPITDISSVESVKFRKQNTESEKYLQMKFYKHTKCCVSSFSIFSTFVPSRRPSLHQENNTRTRKHSQENHQKFIFTEFGIELRIFRISKILQYSVHANNTYKNATRYKFNYGQFGKSRGKVMGEKSHSKCYALKHSNTHNQSN